MDQNELQQMAHQRAVELPGSELTYPFGADWDVWKVRGKVFMLQTKLTGAEQVILKIDPLDGEALRSGYAEITTGYHMNKKHWISVHPGEGIDGELLRDLVTESYLLVVEKLPQRERPVDVYSFGQR